MEDKETLKTSTLISKLTGSVQDKINQLLPDSIMATGVVISSIFLSSDKLLGMEKLTISTSTNLILSE